MILISTDYVFDGRSPPYRTNAPTNPLNHYGATKRAAEIALWESKHTGGVLRIPVLYGPVLDLEESSVTKLVKTVVDHKPSKVDHLSARYPTHTADVAQVVKELAVRRIRHCGLTGTWHFSNNERLTKYEMCLRIAAILGRSHDHLTPQTEEEPGAAPRPLDTQLDCAALNLMRIGNNITPFEQGITEVLRDFPALFGHA